MSSKIWTLALGAGLLSAASMVLGAWLGPTALLRHASEAQARPEQQAPAAKKVLY